MCYEMVVRCSLRLAGYNAGMWVPAMPNIDEVDRIVAVRMMTVHDLAELQSMRPSEPEVWCLPW